MDYLDMKNVIGNKISEQGKNYTIIGPETDNFTLVKFKKGENYRETFWEAYVGDNGFESYILNVDFPLNSVLCHGKTAAIILLGEDDKERNYFGIFDMKNLKFVPNEAINKNALLNELNLDDEYNIKALHTLCSDPSEFVEFLKENGLPKSDEAKLLYFDIANRIINLQKDNTLKSISTSLYGEDEATKAPQKNN